MIDLVVARSDDVDEQTMHALRAALPAERRRKSDTYYREADRHASIVAFSLLQQVWGEQTGDALPQIVLGRFGKPEFADNQRWHFNLSHDASFCVCVLASMPVGVDVQSRVPFDGGLFERMAAPGEQRLRDQLARLDDLSGLWSRKEALVKQTGHGLTTVLQDVDTLVSTEVLTLSDDERNLRLSVSAAGLDEQGIHSGLRIRWLRPVSSPATWVERQENRTWRRLTCELADVA